MRPLATTSSGTSSEEHVVRAQGAPRSAPGAAAAGSARRDDAAPARRGATATSRRSSAVGGVDLVDGHEQPDRRPGRRRARGGRARGRPLVAPARRRARTEPDPLGHPLPRRGRQEEHEQRGQHRREVEELVGAVDGEHARGTASPTHHADVPGAPDDQQQRDRQLDGRRADDHRPLAARPRRRAAGRRARASRSTRRSRRRRSSRDRSKNAALSLAKDGEEVEAEQAQPGGREEPVGEVGGVVPPAAERRRRRRPSGSPGRPCRPAASGCRGPAPPPTPSRGWPPPAAPSGTGRARAATAPAPTAPAEQRPATSAEPTNGVAEQVPERGQRPHDREERQAPGGRGGRRSTSRLARCEAWPPRCRTPGRRGAARARRPGAARSSRVPELSSTTSARASRSSRVAWLAMRARASSSRIPRCSTRRVDGDLRVDVDHHQRGHVVAARLDEQRHVEHDHVVGARRGLEARRRSPRPRPGGRWRRGPSARRRR